MNAPLPVYHLYVETRAGVHDGVWRFELVDAATGESVCGEGAEGGISPDRLELLAFVRSLEGLDQPSRIVVHAAGRYVRHGLAYGLDQWRNNGWRWERFGVMVPIKHRDLWQRIDWALGFHSLDGLTRPLDTAHATGVVSPDRRPLRRRLAEAISGRRWRARQVATA